MTTKKPWFAQTLNDGDELQDAISSWSVVKEPITSQETPIPGFVALFNDENKTFFRLVPEDFTALQPDEFQKFTQRLTTGIHSAGSTPDHSLCWMAGIPQDKYQSFEINGDLWQNFILIALSYNSELGISVTPVAYNVTRNLTFNISEMLDTPKPKIRQSKNIRDRALNSDEFEPVFRDATDQIEQFKQKLRRLSENQSTTFLEAMDSIIPLSNLKDQNLTKAIDLRDTIEIYHSQSKHTSGYSIFLAIYQTDTNRSKKKNLARNFFSGKTSQRAQDVIKLLAA